MNQVVMINKELHVSLKTGIDMINISHNLHQIVNDSDIYNGNLNATIVGSTGSITTIEYEDGVVKDLKNAIKRLIPQSITYEHERAWHDGNGHSHVQAAILGPSLVLPIRNGKIRAGTWQQVVVINHDNKPRNRIIELTMIGLMKEY